MSAGVLALAALTCALALSPAPVAAQALWLDRTTPKALMLELLHPEFTGDDDLTTFSGVVFFTGRTEFSPSVHCVGELSFAHADFHGDEPEGLDGAMLGSPYFGVEVGGAHAVTLLEAGIRVPIDDSEAAATGLALGGDLERQSAWYEDAITTRLGVRVRSRPRTELGLWFEGRIAPEFVYDLDRTEFDLHATYGATVRITRSWLRGGVGIGGRAIFEPPDDDDTIEAAHVVEVAADFLSGALRPGLSVRLPFDGNFGETYDSTVGLQVTYVL